MSFVVVLFKKKISLFVIMFVLFGKRESNIKTLWSVQNPIYSDMQNTNK